MKLIASSFQVYMPKRAIDHGRRVDKPVNNSPYTRMPNVAR